MTRISTLDKAKPPKPILAIWEERFSQICDEMLMSGWRLAAMSELSMCICAVFERGGDSVSVLWEFGRTFPTKKYKMATRGICHCGCDYSHHTEGPCDRCGTCYKYDYDGTR